MSSDHTWVRNREYRKLQNEARRAASLAEDLNNIKQNAQRREHQLQNEYESNINNLNQRILGVQREHNEDISRLNNRFRQELVRQGKEISQNLNDFEKRVGKEVNRINVNINAINDRVNTLAEDFGQQFENIARRQNNARQNADVYIKELDNVLNDISQLDPERFAPGELSSLTQQLNSAKQNFSNENYEASLAVTQVRLIDAYRLHSKLSILNRMFIEHINQLQRASSQIETKFNELTNNIMDFEFNGDTFKEDCDIDYWTSGSYSNLQNRFNHLSAQLQNYNQTNWGLNDLDKIEADLNDIDRSVLEHEQAALEELVHSFAVEDMALQMHNTITEQGWSLVSSGYQDNDKRNPYHIVYIDGIGNGMGIVIHHGENPEDVLIDMEVIDLHNDEIYRNTIKDGIRSNLNESGITVGQTQRRNDCGIYTGPESFVEARLQAYQKESQRRPTSV